MDMLLIRVVVDVIVFGTVYAAMYVFLPHVWPNESVVKMNTIECNEHPIASEMLAELARAREAFPIPMGSAHEGWATLYEEVDELWDEVKAKQSDPKRLTRMRAEAIQVGAMAMRLVADVCDRDPKKS